MEVKKEDFYYNYVDFPTAKRICLLQAPPKGPIQPYDPSFFDEFAAPEYGGYISSESRSSKGLPRGSVAPVPPGMRGGMRGGRYAASVISLFCCCCWFFF